MKKLLQRVVALGGAVLLAGIYLLTLVAAFVDRSAGRAWLKASVTVTILVPVLLYAILLIKRGLQGKDGKRERAEK